MLSLRGLPGWKDAPKADPGHSLLEFYFGKDANGGFPPENWKSYTQIYRGYMILEASWKVKPQDHLEASKRQPSATLDERRPFPPPAHPLLKVLKGSLAWRLLEEPINSMFL